jgi:type II secretory pathway pseudopilin PulG
VEENPYASPQAETHEAPTPPRRRLRIVEMLIVLAIIGILVGLFLPAKRNARGAARRTQCANNLKLIALALSKYEDMYRQLPPAYTVDADGQPLHSWRTLLLPFLEQEALYQKIDLAKPWNHPDNKEAFETEVLVYRCPTLDALPNHTTYSAVVGENYFLHPTQSRLLSQITDSAASTLAVVEVEKSLSAPWMQPKDTGASFLLIMNQCQSLPHPEGIQAVFANNAVHFIRRSTDVKSLKAMRTIAGGDDDAIVDRD